MRTMSLLERLTDSDRLELQERQNSAISAARQLVAAEKVRRAGYKAELKRLDGERDTINDQLMSGRMSKQVSVEERVDYSSGKAYTYRLDNGVEVAIRDIVPGERQPPLPNTTAVVAEKTEEQEMAETPEEAEAARADRLAAQRAAQRAGEAAKGRVDSIMSKIVILLPAETGNGKFTAKVGAVAGFPWGDAGCKVDGETTDEARSKLVSFMLAKTQDQEEELDRRWMESIVTKVDGFVSGATVVQEEEQFVASVTVGEAPLFGSGRSDAGARSELRAIIVDHLRAEITALTQQQNADAGKGGRKGLKAPKRVVQEETAPDDGGPTAF